MHKLKSNDIGIVLCFFFSRMPELHINGRSSSHNSSPEVHDFGASYDTGSSLFFTAESYNSTIAISTSTNTMDSETSFRGIVIFITCFCFALVIMIAIGILYRKKKTDKKTRESQESNLSLHLLPIPLKNVTEEIV